MLAGHHGAELLFENVRRRLNLGAPVLAVLLAAGPGVSGKIFAGTYVVFGPKDYQTASGKPKTANDKFSVLNPLET